jgi:anti-sigma-K factor RskA
LLACAAMPAHETLAELEDAFHEVTAAERHHRQQLRRQAAQRARSRRQEQVERASRLRFAGLVLAILATTVVVTVLMFEALALIIG